MTWVTGDKCESETGFTSGQRKARRQRKYWRQGTEWALIDGTMMYDLAAIEGRANALAVNQRDNRESVPKYGGVVKLR